MAGSAAFPLVWFLRQQPGFCFVSPTFNYNAFTTPQTREVGTGLMSGHGPSAEMRRTSNPRMRESRNEGHSAAPWILEATKPSLSKACLQVWASRPDILPKEPFGEGGEERIFFHEEGVLFSGICLGKTRSGLQEGGVTCAIFPVGKPARKAEKALLEAEHAAKDRWRAWTLFSP